MDTSFFYAPFIGLVLAAVLVMGAWNYFKGFVR